MWGSTDATTFESDIVAQRFDEAAGRSWDLGGGCGLGGKAIVSCGKPGNAGFTIRLQHAAPASPAWLIRSPDTI